jgi:sodium-dependent dicarboxylate transporter 2/3/5
MPFQEAKRHYEKINAIWILVAVILAVLSFFLFPDLQYKQRVVFSSMVLAAILWITDAIPLFVTSMIIPFVLVLFGVFKPKEALNPFFDPIIMLFIGGLLIARALRKLELDLKFVNWFLPRIKNAKLLLFAFIAGTDFLSLWMANTAAAAIMLPIGLASLRNLKAENFSKAVVLGIAFGSSIGGIGTLVGTPPNALASGLVEESTGRGISFYEWLLYGMPITIILTFLCYILLVNLYKPEIKEVYVKKTEKKPMRFKDILFLAIFVITVILWLTEPIHKVPSAIVALGAGVALFLFNILDEKDMNTLGWSVLLLFGGGLVLGEAATKTGFAEAMVKAIEGFIARGILFL